MTMSDRAERVILATNLALARIRDRIQDHFDSFKIKTVWWAGNGETSEVDVVYGLFGIKNKYLFGFIPWRKKTLLFIINPRRDNDHFSSADYGAYLYYSGIRDVAREEFDNYCEIIDTPYCHFFDIPEISLNKENKINDIKEKFVSLPVPNDDYRLLIEFKVEELSRLKKEKDVIEQKIVDIEVELELERDSPKLLNAVSK